MNTEIERKFLIAGGFDDFVSNKYEIKQGYISTDPEKTVRIRTKNTKGFITIKGKSSENGMSRMEWEREISIDEANELLKLCNKPIIEKTRHIVNFKNKVFEIDEFFGANKGLLLAEVELQSEDELVELPNFIGKEVTNDVKYYNSYISQNPFCTWND